MTERGRSIVIEGNDGTGKSTQVDLLGNRLLDEYGINSLIIHEPDGPGISAAIREVIKNGSLERDAITNLLLFTASRHESNRAAEAALADGTWVLKARDWSSSEAYQGGGEGLDSSYIRRVTEEFTSPHYMNPDLKVILGLQDEVREKRIAGRGELVNPDTFEMRDIAFQQRVNHSYLAIANREGYPLIDATKSINEVHAEIMELLWVRKLLPRR
jgi:dTMP kinase